MRHETALALVTFCALACGAPQPIERDNRLEETRIPSEGIEAFRANFLPSRQMPDGNGYGFELPSGALQMNLARLGTMVPLLSTVLPIIEMRVQDTTVDCLIDVGTVGCAISSTLVSDFKLRRVEDVFHRLPSGPGMDGVAIVGDVSIGDTTVKDIRAFVKAPSTELFWESRYFLND